MIRELLATYVVIGGLVAMIAMRTSKEPAAVQFAAYTIFVFGWPCALVAAFNMSRRRKREQA